MAKTLPFKEQVEPNLRLHSILS